jgi:hypothetical protein
MNKLIREEEIILNVFGTAFKFYVYPNDIMNLIIIINNINTIPGYYSSLVSTLENNGTYYGYTNISVRDFLSEDVILHIIENEKKWFRIKRIDSIIEA